MAQRQFRSDDTAVWTFKYGNGSDGTKTVSADATYDGANAGCSGTASSTSLTLDSASSFANGDLVLIHQSRGTGVGSWELNQISSGGGTTSLTMTSALINTYTDSGASQAQIIELKQYSSVTVNSGVTWSAPTWDGNTGGIIAFLCTGATTVTGTIQLSEKGTRTTPAVAGFAGTTSYAGEGTVGDKTQQATANGTGGGGTIHGAGRYPAGAGGGHAASGSNGSLPNTSSGTETAGTGGGTGGTANLVTMIFGGSGGSSAGIAGAGGASGGIGLIISRTITVTGAISSAGGAGQAAGGDGDDSAAGGGGSGGSILLKGQTITLGSSLVTAAAGSGGTDPFFAANGGNGSVGRIHADYSVSLSGTTSPTIDSTQDRTLDDSGGGSFLFNFL